MIIYILTKTGLDSRLYTAGKFQHSSSCFIQSIFIDLGLVVEVFAETMAIGSIFVPNLAPWIA